MHKYFFNPLYLDLYVKPTTTIGQPSSENSTLALTPTNSSWFITPGASTPNTADAITDGAATLSTYSQAVAVLPAIPFNLYSLQTTGATSASGAAPTVALQCLTAANVALLQSVSSGITASNAPSLSVAVLCPPGTTNLAVTLANKGSASVRFNPVTLYETGALKHN
jgi:hypothetical protein